MTDWKPVETQSKTVGPYQIVYLRGPGPEGGHEIRFPDGQTLRVLPDGSTSGKYRSKRIVSHLEAVSASFGPGSDSLVRDMVLGYLIRAGLNVELGEPDRPSPAEIIGADAVRELADAGYEIV